MPEAVLQTAETSSANENIPRRWCNIGTRLSKATAAHIPSSFVLADAFDVHGEEYVWLPSNTPGIFARPIISAPDTPKSPISSPQSALPVDMDIELPREQPEPPTHEPAKQKRKREVEDVGEV